MKKVLRCLFVFLLIVAIMTTAVGCYVVSGQKMDKVKGTYKLTRYSYTPKYERKDGYTPTTINYIEDEKYLFEDYLVVTGTGIGYYVHKDANTEAFSKEVTLSYEYDVENSSKVEFVIFNDSITINEQIGENKLGVMRGSLNYSKAGFDYTELFTDRKMRSEDISIRWEKVDNATNLSYVESELGSIKQYDYQAFGVRGIYKLGSIMNTSTNEFSSNGYKYFYYVIDTANNTVSAVAYYALNGEQTEPVSREATISHVSDNWNVITIDGEVWTIDPLWSSYYYREHDGFKYEISCVSNDISDAAIQSLIESHNPPSEN